MLLENYQKKYPNLFNIVGYENNRGLGYALSVGVRTCKNALIARMDTDDICRNDRFEKQLKAFSEDPSLDICGSQIYEFEDDINHIVAKRIVPLSDSEIKKYHRWRDGFNHVTVMFKRDTVLRAGNYQSCLLMEDTLLWANMFNIGARGMNIDEPLVYVRIGKDMFNRRGGWNYFKKYRDGRKRVYETGFINFREYSWTIFIQFIVAMVPEKLRAFIFKKLLHN